MAIWIRLLTPIQTVAAPGSDPGRERRPSVRRRDRNVLVVLLLSLCLAACEDAGGTEIDAGAPDAEAFCNPSREECGYCGVDGHECCWDAHRRPEDTRPAFYCIDGSACVGGGVSTVCLADDAPPAPSEDL